MRVLLTILLLQLAAMAVAQPQPPPPGSALDKALRSHEERVREIIRQRQEEAKQRQAAEDAGTTPTVTSQRPPRMGSINFAARARDFKKAHHNHDEEWMTLLHRFNPQSTPVECTFHEAKVETVLRILSSQIGVPIRGGEALDARIAVEGAGGIEEMLSAICLNLFVSKNLQYCWAKHGGGGYVLLRYKTVFDPEEYFLAGAVVEEPADSAREVLVWGKPVPTAAGGRIVLHTPVGDQFIYRRLESDSGGQLVFVEETSGVKVTLGP